MRGLGHKSRSQQLSIELIISKNRHRGRSEVQKIKLGLFIRHLLQINIYQTALSRTPPQPPMSPGSSPRSTLSKAKRRGTAWPLSKTRRPKNRESGEALQYLNQHVPKREGQDSGPPLHHLPNYFLHFDRKLKVSAILMT